jgi:ATP-binding cassette subfamily B protein
MSESFRYSAATIYRRLFAEARPYWGPIVGLFVLNLLTAPLKLLVPLPLKITVDSVLGDKPLSALVAWLPGLPNAVGSTQLLVFACVFLVLVTFFAYVNGLLIWLAYTYTGERMLLRFRSKLLGHLQELPLAYHDSRGVTDSAYRIQVDAQAIQWIVLDGLQPFITSAVTIVAMLVVIGSIDWMLACIAVVLAPILLVLTHTWGNRLRREWESAKQLESSALSVVQESLQSLRVVKAFAAEKREKSRFTGRAWEGVRGHMRVALSQGMFDLIVGVLLAAGTATALYIGVRHVQANVMSLGDFLLVWAYFAELLGPLQLIGKKLSTIQGALASADRTLAVLDEMPKVFEKPDALPLSAAAGDLVFDNVEFSYSDGAPTIQEMSFDIRHGRCAGIIGTTGAGKTTIAALVMRFYDPNAGRILLDDHDLRDYRLEDLRNQFSVVLQEPVLFCTSIAENIAYGRPGASMDEIRAAAEAANAHLFIEQMPEGYNAVVGDRGMMLSGGERQRIALARAFLKDAPLLILDEPTSAVDAHTEAIIIEALTRLIRGRTTLLITHRTSLLSMCDLVLTVEHGRLVDVRPGPRAIVPASSGTAMQSRGYGQVRSI